MGLKERGLIFDWNNNWEYRDFCVGFNLCYQRWNQFREYYINISLGFWQLSVGFRL